MKSITMLMLGSSAAVLLAFTLMALLAQRRGLAAMFGVGALYVHFFSPFTAYLEAPNPVVSERSVVITDIDISQRFLAPSLSTLTTTGGIYTFRGIVNVSNDDEVVVSRFENGKERLCFIRNGDETCHFR